MGTKKGSAPRFRGAVFPSFLRTGGLRSSAAKGQRVFRWFILCLSLFVSISVGTTSVAHAFEPQGDFTIAATSTAMVEAFGHTQGDADEVPADSDKGIPHHHANCHGDHLVAPLEAGPVVAAVETRNTTPSSGLQRLVSADPSTALRPPQA